MRSIRRSALVRPSSASAAARSASLGLNWATKATQIAAAASASTIREDRVIGMAQATFTPSRSAMRRATSAPLCSAPSMNPMNA